METRLVPLNAIISMATHGDIYPSPLGDSGYRVVGIEVPVATGDSKVVVDVVLFNPARNVVLACEGKSGANVEDDQARRYAEIDAESIIRSASINVETEGAVEVQPVYVCLAEHADRISQGLAVAECDFPVIAIGDEVISQVGATFTDPKLAEQFASPIEAPGPPGRYVPVDEDSPAESFDVITRTAAVRLMTHGRDQVSVPALAEDALQHLPLYGKAAKKKMVDKVNGAARRLGKPEDPDFEYLPRTETRDPAVLRFCRQPETAARQGRTQVYQALKRGGELRGPRPKKDPNQMALLDDLIDELESANDSASADLVTEEEAEQ